MGKPGQTDYGKGSCNRVSDFQKFENNFDDIDFGGHIIKYFEEGTHGTAGYYILYTNIDEVDGPYNTWQTARTQLK
jgi:hypothetical protein